MNLRAFLIGGGSVLFGLCLVVAVVNSMAAQVQPPTTPAPSTQPAAPPAPVGRFQVSTSGPLLFMIDTAMGEVWQSNGSVRWQHVVNPLSKSK
jgi:hypothetical protein